MKQVGKSNWYELSDGTKVQGRANAEAAEAELTGNGAAEVSRYGAPYAAVVDVEPTDPNVSRYGAPYAEVVQE